MSIFLFQFVRAILIIVLGLLISKYNILQINKIAPLYGRINRKTFLLFYLVLAIIMWGFYSAIDSAMESVVVLPAYWFVRTILFLGSIISVPFYMTLVSRRLQDIALPGALSIPWVFFLIFAPAYGVLYSTAFTFRLIIIIGTIILCILPGTKGPNTYGDTPQGRRSIRSSRKGSSIKGATISKVPPKKKKDI